MNRQEHQPSEAKRPHDERQFAGDIAELSRWRNYGVLLFVKKMLRVVDV